MSSHDNLLGACVSCSYQLSRYLGKGVGKPVRLDLTRRIPLQYSTLAVSGSALLQTKAQWTTSNMVDIGPITYDEALFLQEIDVWDVTIVVKVFVVK